MASAQNVPVYFLKASDTRNSEYTGTPFTDTDGNGNYNTYLGCNRAASNAPGIGISTATPDPKASDWDRTEDTAAHESQHIGKTGDDINCVEGTDFNNELAFVQAEGNTADDAQLDTTTSALNRSGAQVDANSWIWGGIAVA